MYKFKTSKYKNAMPKVPKRENWILDINVGSPQSHGNHIKASAAFIAFNCDARGGGSLGILPLNSCGRIKKNMPMLHCHSELVTDFDFSPFDDGLLATGSQDCNVKIWRIPEDGLSENLVNPELTLPIQSRRIENIAFHPTADFALATSCSTTVNLWDISVNKNLWEFGNHCSQVLNIGWKEDGSLLATLAKDRILRVLDPRSDNVAQETTGHQNPKDGRVVWLGNTDNVLTTGFDSSHQRQVSVRDVRNFSQPLKSLSPDTATGILIPLFDCDTNMLFLAGKADSSVIFMEVCEREPYLTEASRHTCEQPIKGACLIPKRALNVMQCEVNRLLQLTAGAIIPVTYQVPRKTFRDFHGDLFPDTKGAVPMMTAEEWFHFADFPVPKVSLDPTQRQEKTLLRFAKERLSETIPEVDRASVVDPPPPSRTDNEVDEVFASVMRPTADKQGGALQTGDAKSKQNGTEERSPQAMSQSQMGPVPAPRRRRTSSTELERVCRSGSVDSTSGGGVSGSPLPVAAPRATRRKGSRDENGGHESDHRNESHQNGSSSPAAISFASPSSPTPNRNSNMLSSSGTPLSSSKKTSKIFPGFRTSKFRHLKGAPLHRSTHIENIRNLSTSIPGECDGFHANKDRVAVPLRGPGGKIAIFELNKPGRLPDGIVPVVQNGTTVMDFAWDPFDNSRLAVACDDAKIRIWLIPSGGLSDSITAPEAFISGHTEKIYFIKYHPLARDVLASGSYDFTVRIWDLGTGEEKIRLEGHSDQIFGLAWRQDGIQLATVCKDNKLRVYEPRKSLHPIKEGVGPVGNRGARVVWALDGKCLVVTGFDRVSERQVSVYNVESLGEPLTTVGIDVSPAILIPFYDEDSCTLFVTCKGDSTIFAYEVCSDSPYLFPLSHHKCPTSHQALAFLPKCVCNVKDVEFARALRLTPSTVEPLSFTVPRVKTEFFQNDIFPDTRVTWEPTLKAGEWFSGSDKPVRKISLQPEGMQPLTGTESNSSDKQPDVIENHVLPTKQPVFLRKGKADLNTLFATMAISDEELPQDSMEGVEAKEWDDD